MRSFWIIPMALILAGCSSISPVFAGKVNGRQITNVEYQNVVNTKFESYHLQHGVSPADSTMNRFREDAWNDIVRSVVLQQAYQKYGITVTNAEVMDSLHNYVPPAIRTLPIFTRDGEFDRAIYLQSLETNKPYDLTYLKNRYFSVYIPYCKLRNYIGGEVPVSETEVQTETRVRHGSADVRLIEFPAASFPVPVVSQGDIQAYYNAHSSELAVPPRCDVDFLAIPLHPSSADTLFAKTMIDSVWTLAQGGSDFVTLVRKYSDADTANKNGEIGYVSLDDLRSDVRDLVNATDIGRCTPPHAIEGGWRLLQVVSRTKTMVKLRELVITPHVSKATRDVVYDKVTDVRTLAEEVGLKKAAKENDLTCYTFAGLAHNRLDIPQLGYSYRLFETAMQSKEGELLAPMFNSKSSAYMIVQVYNLQSGKIPSLFECADQIRGILEQQRRMEAAQATALDWRTRYEASTAMIEAGRLNYPVLDIPGFDYATNVNGRYQEPLNRAILSTDRMGIQVEPLPLSDGWALAVVTARHQPTAAEEAVYRNESKSILQQHAAQKFFDEWLSKQITHAKVVRYRQPAPVQVKSVKELPVQENSSETITE